MRKSAAEQLKDAKRGAQASEPTVQLDLSGLATRMLGGPPEPTQWEFICDPSEDKAYMGRAGAAKTSTLIAAMMMRCLLQPGFKGVIMRQHYNDMFNTVIERAEEMLNRLSPSLLLDRNKSPPMRWVIRSAVDDGVSTLLFSGLNDLPKGFEAHAIAVDEADECDEKHINALRMRMRLKDAPSCLMLAFNPPDKTHWLYTAATGRDAQERVKSAPWLKLFCPKDGENLKNLKEGYYTDKAKGMPEDLRQRFIIGTWGDVFEGQPVYREFSPKLHVDPDLKPDTRWPMMRWRDFGYRAPAVIWAQMDEDTGCVNIFDEMQGDHEEVKAFEHKVQAASNIKFRNFPFIDFGDPAVDQHKDTGHTLQMLQDMGVYVNFIRSDLDQGIRQVRLALERITRGRPQILIHPRCALLIRALRGGYRMNDSGTRPLKDGTYDHLADAFRYGIINVYDMDGGLKPLPQTSNFYALTGTYGGHHGVPDSVEYDASADPDAINRGYN